MSVFNRVVMVDIILALITFLLVALKTYFTLQDTKAIEVSNDTDASSKKSNKTEVK